MRNPLEYYYYYYYSLNNLELVIFHWFSIMMAIYQLNSAIIDLEKLTLSKKKCHNIHIGKQNVKCPALKVHGNKMENSTQERYLGDIVHNSGTNKASIDKRKSRGYGITSEILAIVNEIPLAHWKIQAGLSLRQAMLVNGNSSTRRPGMG